MHNEPEAVRELQALSLNAKAHLSHILRNGIGLIRASIKQDNEELKKMERTIEELGI
ncbi:MAG: hypothetical protein AAB922_06630 [Patescibacteria group bacterium]